MDLVEGLNRDNGQTFVIVTHDLHIAERCYRIINMLDGQIVDEVVTERGRNRGTVSQLAGN
jgi:putative ABC transport system ATP-binding protein